MNLIQLAAATSLLLALALSLPSVDEVVPEINPSQADALELQDLGSLAQADTNVTNSTPFTWEETYYDHDDDEDLTSGIHQADVAAGGVTETTEDQGAAEATSYHIDVDGKQYKDYQERMADKKALDSSVDNEAIHWEVVKEMAMDYPNSTYSADWANHTATLAAEAAAKAQADAAAKAKFDAEYEAAMEEGTRTLQAAFGHNRL